MSIIQKRLGFLILTSEKIDNQFIRLLERLNEFPNASITIHHDKEQAGEFPVDVKLKYGVKIIEKSYRTYWSHINNVLATIDGFEALYKDENKIDWFITLTPSCYPIKPIDKIQEFYNNCNNDALIEMEEVRNNCNSGNVHKFIIRDLQEQPWFKIPFMTKKGEIYLRTFRKKIAAKPHPYLDSRKLYHGSNWFSINRKVVEAIIKEKLKDSELVKFYERYVKASPDMHPCPQEIVLPTFIGNIPDINIDYHNFRYINWDGTTCWSPNSLDVTFWKDIYSSSAFFARKFKAGYSDELITKIDHDLL